MGERARSAARLAESTGTSISTLAPAVSSDCACVLLAGLAGLGILDGDRDAGIGLLQVRDAERLIELPAGGGGEVGEQEADAAGCGTQVGGTRDLRLMEGGGGTGEQSQRETCRGDGA